MKHLQKKLLNTIFISPFILLICFFLFYYFLSIIWFTSKLANNTEIVAFLSSGVSFYRFLRPYLFGATIVCLIAISFSMYIVPKLM